MSEKRILIIEDEFCICDILNYALKKEKYEVKYVLTGKEGLELGADDYITKPFDIREGVSRVKVSFRRIENINQYINEFINVRLSIRKKNFYSWYWSLFCSK